ESNSDPGQLRRSCPEFRWIPSRTYELGNGGFDARFVFPVSDAEPRALGRQDANGCLSPRNHGRDRGGKIKLRFGFAGARAQELAKLNIEPRKKRGRESPAVH